MKNFSKKNLTKACAFMLGGALCFAVAGAASVNVASADTTLTPEQIAAATTNIEDMISAKSDFDIFKSDGVGSHTKNATDSSLTWTGGGIKWGQVQMHNSTVLTDNADNVLDYDGNLALWEDSTKHNNYNVSGKTVMYMGLGYRLLGDTAYGETNGEGYGLVRFRTRYDETINSFNLGMMVNGGENVNVQSNSKKRGGYGFSLLEAKTIELNKATADGTAPSTLKNGITYTENPSEGDLLDITYGVLKDGDNNVLYLNIDRQKADGTTENLIEYEYTDTSVSTLWCADEANKCFSVTFASSASRTDGSDTSTWNTADFNDGILLAGVEEPIFEENLAWTEKTAVTAGTKLSDVTLSKKGYTFADSNATVTIGENTGTATLTDYYGQTTDVTATVTLTGTPDFAAATTNIEDMIDSYDDFKVIQANSGSFYAGSTVDWNGDGQWMGNMWVHSANKTGGAYEGNVVDYDGNLGLWTDDSRYKKSTSTTWYASVGFNLTKETAYGETNSAGYGLIRFRTKWDDTWNALDLCAMVRPDTGYVSPNSTARGGYGFQLTQSAIGFSEHIIVAEGEKNIPTAITSAVPTWKNGGPSGGNVLEITYGVYKHNDTNILYLNIDERDATSGNWSNICNFVYTDVDTTDNYFNENGKVFAFKTSTVVKKGTVEPNDGLLLAGVNEPILTDVVAKAKALDGIEADETDGTLSAVVLDDGYAWKNGDITLEKGEYEYDATYTYNYYGKSTTVDVKVGVTVTGVRTTLELKDGDTVLKSVELKTGDTFTLNSATLTGVGTVIGWTAAGSTDLLKPDTVFTATATENTTVVYNVVDIDFKLLDGASIRTVKNEAGNGGIRFVAMFNSDDWAANAAYIQNAYGVIVPTDDATYFNGGFTTAAKTLYTVAENNFVGKDSLSYADVNLTEAQAGGYALYTFAMTDVKYENYNRDFAAMSFITVKYANGDTLDFETAYNEDKNCRSVYEVAVAAIADHKEKGDTVYNNAQLAVLESYIANVVDLAYDEATSSFSVVDREQHGFTRPYGEVVSGTVGQNGEVTVVLTTAEDSILATNDYAPVFVTADGETRRFEAAVAYANGQVTLTFDVTAE